MIDFVKSILTKSKTHRYDLDYSAEAEAMYRGIAADLNLQLVKLPDDPVELSMEFPRQPGLPCRVWVCLQNLDELWFSIDGFTCSMFPFDDVKLEFENYLRGFLSGELRIRKFINKKTGKVVASMLQCEIDGKWVMLSMYGFKLLPDSFYDMKDEQAGQL